MNEQVQQCEEWEHWQKHSTDSENEHAVSGRV